MGYRFSGFFVDSGDASLIDSVRARWPIVDARSVADPFRGFGFAFPDYEEWTYEEEADRILEMLYDAEDELPVFSEAFPAVTFLWIDAVCVGGNCVYSGYACKAGAVFFKEDNAKDALGRLLTVFGIQLKQNQFFRPFTRGFFKF